MNIDWILISFNSLVFLEFSDSQSIRGEKKNLSALGPEVLGRSTGGWVVSEHHWFQLGIKESSLARLFLFNTNTWLLEAEYAMASGTTVSRDFHILICIRITCRSH